MLKRLMQVRKIEVLLRVSLIVFSGAMVMGSEAMESEAMGAEVMTEPAKTDIASTTSLTQLTSYQLIDPVDSEIVGLFVKQRPHLTKIVGYSALGHVFLFAPESQEYVVFNPYQQIGRSCGSFNSTSEFAVTVLQNPEFTREVLQPEFVQQLLLAHGELEKDEVFIPAPYFYSGSKDVSIYERGNIWVMLDITNQLLNG